MYSMRSFMTPVGGSMPSHGFSVLFCFIVIVIPGSSPGGSRASAPLASLPIPPPITNHPPPAAHPVLLARFTQIPNKLSLAANKVSVAPNKVIAHSEQGFPHAEHRFRATEQTFLCAEQRFFRAEQGDRSWRTS